MLPLMKEHKLMMSNKMSLDKNLLSENTISFRYISNKYFHLKHNQKLIILTKKIVTFC